MRSLNEEKDCGAVYAGLDGEAGTAWQLMGATTSNLDTNASVR